MDSPGNTGLYPRKRQRTSQACDQCRKRKSKCDGKRPVCSICGPLKRKCTYGTNGKKRGLQTGYVRGLEILWGLVFKSIEGSENTVQSLLRSDVDGVTVGNWYKELARDGEAPESLLDAWRKSRVARDVEKLLSVADDSDTSDKDSFRTKTILPPVVTAGPSSWKDNNPKRTEVVQSPSTANNVDQTYSAVFASSAAVSSPGSSTMLFPANTWRLLDVYFSYTHCWFPVLEKHDILKTSYTGSASGDSPKSGAIASLWAVLAYTSAQCSGVDRVSKLDEQLYFHAKSHINVEDPNHDLGHVQALLLLSLYQIGKGWLRAAWLLVGQAARMGIGLGIHETHSRKASGRRAHTFWGIFMLDTLLSAVLGRSPCLKSQIAAGVGLLDEDGIEEWDPWVDAMRHRGDSVGRSPAHTLSVFNCSINLMLIINDWACRKNGDSLSSREHVARLKRWKGSLPNHCKFGGEAIPSVLNLHLLWTTSIALSDMAEANEQGLFDTSDPGPLSLPLLTHFVGALGASATPSTFVLFILVARQHVKLMRKYDPAGLRSSEQDILRLATSISTPWSSSLISQLFPADSNSPYATNIEYSNTPGYANTASIIPGDHGIPESSLRNWDVSSALDKAVYSDWSPRVDEVTSRIAPTQSILSPMESRNPHPNMGIVDVPLSGFDVIPRDLSSQGSISYDTEFPKFLRGDINAMIDELTSMDPSYSSLGQSQFIQDLGFTEAFSPDLFSLQHQPG